MLWPAVDIDGNLVIRWHERGAFEVSLVPVGPPPAAPVPIRRVADAEALRELLTDLGLGADRVAHILESPYVLQSQRVRVARGAAQRLGLIPTTRLRQALGLLAQAVTEPTRLARLIARRPPPEGRG